jgi:DNA-binding NtrC family response regulator
VESAEKALELLEREKFLLLISDAQLGGISGMTCWRKCGRNGRNCRVDDHSPTRRRNSPWRRSKPAPSIISQSRLSRRNCCTPVARCAERFRLIKENASLRARTTEAADVGQIIGESTRMQELRRLIQTVAGSNATVLILGESGTGKELIAGALHSLSPRRPGQLCPHQLRGDPGSTPGKRVVWARERRFHRRGEAEARARGGSRRRDNFPWMRLGI